MQTKIRRHSLLIAILCTSILMAPIQTALACTRILWNDNALAVVAGRTMD